MSAIDILILAVVAVGGVIGFSRGLLVQVGSIAALVIGVLAARLFGQQLAGLWGDGSSALDSAAGYGIAFLIGYAATWLVARMMKKTVHTIHLGIIDRVGGCIFKAFQWGLVLSLALNIYVLATGSDAELRAGNRPWRTAAIDLAPAVLGYLTDIANIHAANDVNTPKSENDK